MRDTSTRVFSLMCALVGVWVVVYWFYEPAKPPVTLDPGPKAGGDVPIRPDPLAQLDRRVKEGGTGERTPERGATKPEPTRREAGVKKAEREVARAVPPKFTEYVVQRGDTFEVIARRMLGDARHWKSIAAANAFVDPTRLVPGRTVLRIPVDPRNVHGTVIEGPREATVTEPKPAVPQDAAAAKRETAAETSAGFTEYVVKSSDTLSGIAKAFYGKSAMWREIYEANKNVIDDPDRLKPGVTIRVPRER